MIFNSKIDLENQMLNTERYQLKRIHIKTECASSQGKLNAQRDLIIGCSVSSAKLRTTLHTILRHYVAQRNISWLTRLPWDFADFLLLHSKAKGSSNTELIIVCEKIYAQGRLLSSIAPCAGRETPAYWRAARSDAFHLPRVRRTSGATVHLCKTCRRSIGWEEVERNRQITDFIGVLIISYYVLPWP